MTKLKESDNLICIQQCLNTYGGKHGEIDYSACDRSTIDTHCKNNVEWQSAVVNFSFGEALCIVIRGSDEPDDWKSNFRFFKSSAAPFGNKKTKIRIHRGFLHDNDLIRSDIFAAIEKYAKKTVVVCGHSKGAAQALIASSDIQYNYPDIDVICRAFASPRIGNKHYWESRKNRIHDTICYRYGTDIVTRVPLLISYSENWNLKRLYGKHINSCKDHYPINYYNAIKKLV